jgi:hypothetical protein
MFQKKNNGHDESFMCTDHSFQLPQQLTKKVAQRPEGAAYLLQPYLQ